MDLTPVDIVGKRCYQFIHAEDVEGIRQCHLDCEYRPHLCVKAELCCVSAFYLKVPFRESSLSCIFENFPHSSDSTILLPLSGGIIHSASPTHTHTQRQRFAVPV